MSAVPRARHSREHRRPAALLARSALVAAVAVLVLSVSAGAVVFLQLDGNIQSQDVLQGVENRPEQDPESTEALDILLIGSDSRDIEGGDRFGGTAASPGLSDTTILLHLAADRSRATFVSIPRDSMVDLPSCPRPDGTTAPERFGQFNSAYATGGAACTIMTVESLTGVYIDHFAVVDFVGFEQAVDALGGVPVCLPEPVSDRFSGLNLPAGEQRLDGTQALAYVRARKIGDGSDLGRIGRQQAFLASAVQEATSTGVLLRPDRLLGVLDAGTRSLTTDPDLASLTALTSLANSVRELPPEQVSFVTVPNGEYEPDPNRVVWTPEADVLWEAIRRDEPIPGVDATEPAEEPSASPAADPASPSPDGEASATAGDGEPELTVSPGEITVLVHNTGAAQGAAAGVAEALAAQGFEVVAAENGDLPSSGVTVWVPPGKEEAARTVAAAFGDPRVSVDETLPAGSPIVVAIGSGAGPGAVRELPSVPGEDEPSVAESPGTQVRQASDDICTL